MLSVIIPVFNGADVLGEQLEALAGSVPSHEFEVIISDNGSTDQSRSVAESFADRLPIRIIDSSARRGNAAARNIGAAAALGELVAFLDQDDEVTAGWVDMIAAALADADVVVGPMPIAWDWPNRDRAARGEAASRGDYGWLPYGLSANMAMTRAAFDALGGFDETYSAATDLDICWRAQLAGLRFAGVDDAVVLKRAKGHGAFRQHFEFGFDDAVLFKRFGASGMPRGLAQTAKRYGWLLLNLPRLRSASVRSRWVRVAGRCLGRLRGSLSARVAFL